MKKLISIVIICVFVLGVIGAGAFFLFRPKELLGSVDVYNTVTLQLKDNLFYDVRVPVEAVLESTDGSSVYSFDLLTVGVQDMEPTTFCKVNVGGRWVFASSKDGWLKATQVGFEEEQPYSGTFDTELTKWKDSVPPVVMILDQDLLESLQQGASHTLGGKEFVTSQISYGTFDVAVERMLLKMSTLYKQPISYGLLTENRLWVTSNLYTVAVSPINYNTCLTLTSYGEVGKQYLAALMEERA